MKSEIVFIQPIFCPSRELCDVNKRSLNSLYGYLKENPYHLDILLAGYCIKDEYWEEISEIVSRIQGLKCGSVKAKRFKHNYGKSYTVNKISFPYLKNNSKTKYILTFDSDICFDLSEKRMFGRLIEASKRLEANNKQKFGCLSLNLGEFTYHNFKDKTNSLRYDFEGIGDELVWHDIYDGGIAGGALFLGVKAWEMIGGYKRYNQVYAPEDAFLFMSLNTIGFSFCIFKSMNVLHPHNVSQDYAKWKKYITNVKYILLDAYNEDVFKANVKNSEKFWRELNGKN